MKQRTTMGQESYTSDDMSALHDEMNREISDLKATLATAVEANRYALATFRAIGQWSFDDSDHGLLIAEAVKKLEAFHDEGGEQR